MHQGTSFEEEDDEVPPQEPAEYEATSPGDVSIPMKSSRRWFAAPAQRELVGANATLRLGPFAVATLVLG